MGEQHEDGETTVTYEVPVPMHEESFQNLTAERLSAVLMKLPKEQWDVRRVKCQRGQRQRASQLHRQGESLQVCATFRGGKKQQVYDFRGKPVTLGLGGFGPTMFSLGQYTACCRICSTGMNR